MTPALTHQNTVFQNAPFVCILQTSSKQKGWRLPVMRVDWTHMHAIAFHKTHEKERASVVPRQHFGSWKTTEASWVAAYPRKRKFKLRWGELRSNPTFMVNVIEGKSYQWLWVWMWSYRIHWKFVKDGYISRSLNTETAFSFRRQKMRFIHWRGFSRAVLNWGTPGTGEGSERSKSKVTHWLRPCSSLPPQLRERGSQGSACQARTENSILELLIKSRKTKQNKKKTQPRWGWHQGLLQTVKPRGLRSHLCAQNSQSYFKCLTCKYECLLKDH